MTQRQVISAAPERMRRMKTAMHTPVATSDRYRVGDLWHAVNQLSPSESVEAVNHFGRHETAIGDILTIKTIEGELLANVLVTGIRMIHTDDLTIDDLRSLGYSSHDEYLDDWGRAFAGSVWFMDIEHIDRIDQSEVRQ